MPHPDSPNSFPSLHASILPTMLAKLAKFSNPFSSPPEPPRIPPGLCKHCPWDPKVATFQDLDCISAHKKFIQNQPLQKTSKSQNPSPKGRFSLSFWHQCSTFFAKHRNLLNCNWYAAKALFSPQGLPPLHHKPTNKAMFFRHTPLGLIWLNSCCFYKNSNCWPFRNQAGPKMVTNIFAVQMLTNI